MNDRKIREQELHSKIAEDYEERREGTRNGRYYSKEWLRTILKQIELSKARSILDIGCGTGILYEVLQEEGYTGSYVGTDLSPEMLEVGRKSHNGIELRVMDCERLDFDDKSFEIVFMRSVLHHTPDPVEAIKEMKRVAKKTILIAEPLRNIFTELPRYLSKKLTDHFDEDHTHYSITQLQKLLKDGGIEKCHFKNFGYFAYPFGFTDILPCARYLPISILRRLFFLDEAISNVPILRNISWHIIVVCDIKQSE